MFRGWLRLKGISAGMLRLVHRLGAYRALGSLGYLAAVVLVLLAHRRAGATLGDTIIVSLVAPVSFLVAIRIAHLLFGGTRIVFYEKALFALGACALVLHAAARPIAPALDLTTLGLGVFLACGRVGCFLVGCCHGRPAKYGVRYGKTHVAMGFPSHLAGVTLCPVQLLESLLSLALVVAGLAALTSSHTPGTAATIYLEGYGVGRFFLESLRGDDARPLLWGISEAQWTAFLLALGLLAINGVSGGTVVPVILLTACIFAQILRNLFFSPPAKDTHHR